MMAFTVSTRHVRPVFRRSLRWEAAPVPREAPRLTHQRFVKAVESYRRMNSGEGRVLGQDE